MKRLVPRLTYANVVATLALFIAVGGASAFAASKLAKNSVGTKQIKKEAITTVKIKNGAVTGAKVLTSSLGTVPTAAHASSADNAGDAQTLGGKSAGQIAAASKLSCPQGTAMATGLCFETTERPAQNWQEAVLECARAGRSLPSASELVSYEVSTGEETLPPLEWAGGVSYANPGTYGMALGANRSVVAFETPGFLASKPYRCMVGPTN